MSSSITGSVDYLVDARWQLTSTSAGSCAHPRDLPTDASWITAQVPGTVASVLDRPDQDAVDWWFVTTASVREDTALSLTFDGIATYSTIWVDDIEIACTRSMFVPETIHFTCDGSIVDIAVRIGSMDAHLKKRRPRGRWRSSLVAQQGLRHERTTMLGRAPVYGPLHAPVGLWRPVTLRDQSRVRDVQANTSLNGNDGVMRIRAEFDTEPTSVVLRVGESTFALPVGCLLDEEVTIADVALWWPHTHGEPVLYPWSLDVDGRTLHAGRAGFRSAVLERNDASVTLKINDIRVFARGGCWVPPDPTRLWVSADRMRTELEQVRSAGLNMVRVVGTLVYEQPEFWSLCAELGIMVWQDVMFATTDPPEDPEFVGSVEQELGALTLTVGDNPALVVVSGGSETQQQATMLGVPASEQHIPLLQKTIPDLLASELPGVPYVTSSPSSVSGELHTHVGDGIAHYFGVGGYLRPLSDVRTARVRFAAECLAFAVPPERRAVEKMFGSANVAGHHPEWKAAVPRDRGSSWDFEDVRDHYVRDIFGVDPNLVRRDDAELYLDYGRAAVCEAVTRSFEHWRRHDSECGGALVLTLRDLVPGAGWGLRDSNGSPKAPWYSLARMSRPVSVFFVDDGLDGLSIELIDDTAHSVRCALRVALYGPFGPVGDMHETQVELEPHSAQSVSLDRVVGAFADINHAYRFGAQTYVAAVAELVDEHGAVVADATHLIGERPVRQNDVGLTAHAEKVGPGEWTLTVTTQWAAQYVCVDVDGLDISDSWFHLAPGASRTLTLTGDKPKPSGHVRALNSIKRAHFN
ncbi:beta-mannosidase [Rhodococcus sp. G-MC3]|uniref:glycosyl hydrolase 2 galactose-binding domain-containing protein n=1 Tax=Rhodococcus sp. G-MC3 TaxID=3046209 RepID=UPI0024B9B264|nr:glycoside hydrolase family 2 protein [Rhodococcus sp. G-MC3]MDJ0395264.1 beta-mannosidase [Rhodococcus sp. G-MC3]